MKGLVFDGQELGFSEVTDLLRPDFNQGIGSWLLYNAMPQQMTKKK